MNYLKSILSQFCSTHFDQHQPFHQQTNSTLQSTSKTKTNKIHHHLHPDSIDNIIKQCAKVPESKRGRKVQVKDLGDKKLLLLDLDRTIIFFEEKKGFSMRPHLREFLQAISKFYVIYIFTAATFKYLEEMLKLISLNNGGREYISGYLSRENCLRIKLSQKKTVYVKDISVISNVDVSKIVMVDDLLISFCLSPENGILIPAYVGDAKDKKLIVLAKILNQLKDSNDIRMFIRRQSCKNSKSGKNSTSTEQSESPPKNEEKPIKKVAFGRRHQSK